MGKARRKNRKKARIKFLLRKLGEAEFFRRLDEELEKAKAEEGEAIALAQERYLAEFSEGEPPPPAPEAAAEPPPAPAAPPPASPGGACQWGDAVSVTFEGVAYALRVTNPLREQCSPSAVAVFAAPPPADAAAAAGSGRACSARARAVAAAAIAFRREWASLSRRDTRTRALAVGRSCQATAAQKSCGSR